MNTLLVYSAKLFTTGVLSSAVFMLSSFVVPEVADNKSTESSIPALSLNMKEFSPAWSALEDDYYIPNQKEEFIPENVPAIELVAGTVTMQIVNPENQLRIPKISMKARDVFKQQVSSAQSTISPTKNNKNFLGPKLVKDNKYLGEKSLAPHHWIKGEFELIGGLAITDPRDEILLGWFVDGEKKEDGRVFLNEGVYEIKVGEMVGELIAELVDREGRLLGEKIIDLEELAEDRGKGLIIDNVSVTLEPYEFGFHGQALSVYDTESSPDPVANTVAKVGMHDLYFESDDKGRFKEQDVNSDSISLITASKEAYWDTLFLADYRGSQKIRMFPKKYMTALFNTIGVDSTETQSKGVIWGKVLDKGQPSAGYQVRLSETSTNAIYFALYIANSSIERTSKDGQFVFVGIEDGEYELEVINSNGQKVDNKIVVVKSGFVSHIEFEVSNKRSIYFKSFDPLGDDHEKRSLYLFELGSGHNYQGEIASPVGVPVPRGVDPVVLYAKIEGSETETIMLASRNKKYQDIPILNEPWWNQTREALNVSVEDGVMVGFIDSEESFEIFIEDPNSDMRVTYFDAKGKPIDRLKGQRPSGFVVYNMGQGLHTIIIQSKSGRLTTEAAYIDGSAVSLMYKSL